MTEVENFFIYCQGRHNYGPGRPFLQNYQPMRAQIINDKTSLMSNSF